MTVRRFEAGKGTSRWKRVFKLQGSGAATYGKIAVRKCHLNFVLASDYV